jgi:hypothetical protein
VIDANDRPAFFGKNLAQPFGNAPSRPVHAWARRRSYFHRQSKAIRSVDPKPFVAARRRFGA